MEVINFVKGYIVTENDEVAKEITKRIEDDTLWEYVSSLIQNDLNQTKTTHTVDKKLDSIEGLLKSLVTNIDNGAVVTTPKPEPKPESEVIKKPKKVKVTGKGSKGFLAAAKKASSFR